MNKKKLLIIGHMQHGKDTAAEFLKDLYGYTFSSSSQAASEIFLYDVLKVKYGYTTPYECFLDRVNHRSEWYDLICEYNKDDKSRLAKEIMVKSDIYVGMRDDEEIAACVEQGLFDMIVGIYDPRKPLEPFDSFKIDIFQWSDVVVLNNDSLNKFGKRLTLLNYW